MSRPSPLARLAALFALLALVLCAGGCPGQPGTRGQGQALAAGDLGAEGGAGCGGVPAEGCCSGNTLRYCSGSTLVSLVCSGGRYCGWSPGYGLYRCGGAVAADPSGAFPRACPAPDAGPASDAALADGRSADQGAPAPDAVGDAPRTEAGGSCGALAYAGCCLGDVLYFCAGGTIFSRSCRGAPACGWDAAKGVYDCNTSGSADPSGSHPLACGAVWGDAGPGVDLGGGDAAADLGQPDGVFDGRVELGADGPGPGDGFSVPADQRPASDRGAAVDRGPGEAVGFDAVGLEAGSGDLGGGVEEPAGCSCALGSPPGEGGPALMLGLCLLLGAAARRRGRRWAGLSLAAFRNKGRLLLLLGVGLLLIAGGCKGGEPGVSPALSHALSGGDAAGEGGATALPDARTQAGVDRGLDQGAARDRSAGPDRATGCGPVSAKGCCQGQTLFWCQAGQLRRRSCLDRPACGWSAAGQYDCATSGAADPAGQYPRSCAALWDGGLPLPDRGGAGDGGCGGIPVEGCCHGNTLKYCKNGVLQQLSCALNPSCGWLPGGQYYDCGTEGKEDPAGRYPRLCPGAQPADGRPDQPGPGDLAAETSPDLVPVSDDAEGCSCGLASGPGSSGAAQLLLLLVLLVLRGLRRSR